MMTSLPIYRTLKGFKIRDVLIDDVDLEPLQSLGLDYWFLGDKRTHSLLRRSFPVMKKDGRKSLLFLYLHRVIAARMRFKVLEPNLPGVIGQCRSLGKIGLNMRDDYWDCRSSNIVIVEGGFVSPVRVNYEKTNKSLHHVINEDDIKMPESVRSELDRELEKELASRQLDAQQAEEENPKPLIDPSDPQFIVKASEALMDSLNRPISQEQLDEFAARKAKRDDEFNDIMGNL